MKRMLFIGGFLLAAYFSIAGDIKYPVAAIPAGLLKNANAVKRMEEVEIEIAGPKEVYYRYRYALTILNEKGEDYAGVMERYDQLQHIVTFEGALYDEKGNLLKKVKTKDVQDLSAVDGLIDDNRVKSYSFYYRSFPYTVEFEVTVRLDHSFYFPPWNPQDHPNLSVEKSSFTVIMPQDYVLRYKQFNYPGEPVQTASKNKKILTWKLENLLPLKWYYAAPRWHEITPTVSIAPTEFQLGNYKGTMTSWKEFGKFIYELTKNRDELPDNIKEKVREIAASAGSEVEKVQRLYQFMQQNTRYISIQLGIGGWQPFEAAYVSKKGYGDCKALSNYMYSLLKEANIKSYYTLIKAGDFDHYLMEDFPCNQFNHAILCVPLQKDTMWLECTSQTVAPGYMGEFTGNRKALLIDEQGGTLVATPRYRINENVLVRKLSANLDAEGTLNIKVATKYGGTQQDDLSSLINHLSRDKVQKILQEELELSTYNINNFKYEETKAILPELKEELDITVNNYATFSGKRLFITPNVLNRGGWKLEVDEERKIDLVFYSEYRDEDEYEIQIPEGYQLETALQDVSIKTRFGNYASSAKLSGNKIIYHRTIEKFSGRFPAKDQADLAKFFNDIYKADRARMVFVKTQ